MKVLVMKAGQADDMLTLGCCAEEFVDATTPIDIPDGCVLAVVRPMGDTFADAGELQGLEIAGIVHEVEL